MKTNAKTGFTLVEAMLGMLILAIILAVGTPIFTKKKKVIAEKLEHGKWACKYIGDELYETESPDPDSPLPDDTDLKKWKKVKNCRLSSVAANSENIYVKVYGGGGGGSAAKVTPWLNIRWEAFSFPATLPITGYYDITAGKLTNGTAMGWQMSPSQIYAQSNAAKCKSANSFDIVTCPTGSRCKWGETGSNCYCTKTTPACCTPAPPAPPTTGGGSGGSDGGTGPGPKPGGSGFNAPVFDPIKNMWQFLANTLIAQPAHAISCTSPSYQCSYCSETTCYCKPSISCSPSSDYTMHYQCSGTSTTINECTARKNICSNNDVLAQPMEGASAPGVTGLIQFAAGDIINYRKISTGAAVKCGGPYSHASYGGAYACTNAKDGDSYEYFIRRTPTEDDGKTNIDEFKLFSLTPGTAGRITGLLTKIDGIRGKLVKEAIASSLEEIPPRSNDYAAITIQKFESFNGCAGETGGAATSLVPTSHKGNYDIKVGRGGAVNKDGEQTRFGLLVAKGGAGASTTCNTPNKANPDRYAPDPPEATKEMGVGQNNNYAELPNIVSKGGDAGLVEYIQKPHPKRNYALPILQDTAVNNRWTVHNPTGGAGGMVVVTW